MNQYDWADNAINTSPKYGTGFTQLFGASPYILPAGVRAGYDARLNTIREFQRTSVAIFRAALAENTESPVLHWLLNETPTSLGLDYHRSLEAHHYTPPAFFRTDEAAPGQILEIQCPGSLWGELQLVFDYFHQLGNATGVSPATEFGLQLQSLLGGIQPVVHHMLDNASGPAAMRYFIERTRPVVKYWGIDRDVWPVNCNFIRSHSFLGLCAENEFRPRLARCGRDLYYDLPPYVLFDQKAPLALPFWSRTRKLFSDSVRNILVFTTPLLPSGVELPGDIRLSIDEFARWSRGRRSFYLKYAGSDVSCNWGSKEVHRLSNLSSEQCRELLRRCVLQYDSGHTWLIQQEVTQDDDVTFIDRSGSHHAAKLRAKLSGFYGPATCLGVLAMHRGHNKVHGQADTVVSFVSDAAGGGGPCVLAGRIKT